MRYSLITLIAAALVVLGAGSAQATSASLSFENLLGIGIPATATQSGNTVSGLVVGDLIEVGITVDNTAGDAVQALFTFLQADPGVLAIRGDLSVGAPILDQGTFGPGPLSVIGTPEPAFGQPAGTHIGLAHGTTGLPTTAPGPDLAAIAVFEVVGVGPAGGYDITHILTGNSIINQDTGGSALEIVGGPLTVNVVPEPGTALLMGLGLLGLGAAGRRSEA